MAPNASGACFLFLFYSFPYLVITTELIDSPINAHRHPHCSGSPLTPTVHFFYPPSYPSVLLFLLLGYFCCTNYYSVLVPIHFFQTLTLTSGQGHDTPNPSTSMQVSWSLFFTPSHDHASLPPDALKAFKMQKSDSGKQHKQYDTIIPKSNPGPCFWGQPQKMMTSSRQHKA